jgi:hypothetical protein
VPFRASPGELVARQAQLLNQSRTVRRETDETLIASAVDRNPLQANIKRRVHVLSGEETHDEGCESPEAVVENAAALSAALSVASWRTVSQRRCVVVGALRPGSVIAVTDSGSLTECGVCSNTRVMETACNPPYGLYTGHNRARDAGPGLVLAELNLSALSETRRSLRYFEHRRTDLFPSAKEL